MNHLFIRKLYKRYRKDKFPFNWYMVVLFIPAFIFSIISFMCMLINTCSYPNFSLFTDFNLDILTVTSQTTIASVWVFPVGDGWILLILILAVLILSSYMYLKHIFRRNKLLVYENDEKNEWYECDKTTPD